MASQKDLTEGSICVMLQFCIGQKGLSNRIILFFDSRVTDLNLLIWQIKFNHLRLRECMPV